MTGDVILVGGAPRSGTTVVHAIICTSARANGYVAESSFLTHYFRALVVGLRQFNNHTLSFFAEPGHFEAFARGMIRQALDQVRHNVGDPEILALKDPLMTPLFPALVPLYPDMKFVVSVRHPLDVYRSRREVLRLSGGGEPGPAAARSIAEEYVRSYDLDEGPNVHFVRYEDMGTEACLQDLGRFLDLDDFDLARLWERPGGTRVESSEQSPDPWHSPLYGASIQQSTRHQGAELAPGEVQTVLAVTRKVMERFGYE